MINIPLITPKRESSWKKYVVGAAFGIVIIVAAEAIITPWYFAMLLLAVGCGVAQCW